MFRKIVGSFTLALSLPLMACDSGTTVGSPGTLSVLLTDEAGDFTQARVTIERIELVGEGEPVLLRDTPYTTDLLTLANDVATLVDDVTIEAGSYSQLRFIIPEACIGVEQEDESVMVYASDGFEECGPADGALQLPSFDDTGIKVILPGDLEVDGNAQSLLVDFHVSQSFGQQAGMSGTWVMTPVIKADNVSFAGSIVVELTAAETVDLAGSVSSSLADFQASLDTEEVAQPFTDDDEDGVFTATFDLLIPNEPYEVSVGLQDGVSFNFTLDPTSPQEVPLASSENASVSFEVTSASPSS